MYISHFTAGKNTQIWIDKTGSVLRPGIDQLPGTNLDFSLVQNGVLFKDDKYNVTVQMPDTPLIYRGNLGYAKVKLCPHNPDQNNNTGLWSWLMNNFWETNFKASLGGWHSFEYSVYWENKKVSPHETFKKMEALNTGLISFRKK